MNKKFTALFTIIITLLILNQTTSIGQTGKPQYSIRVERADTSLGEFLIELFPLIAPLHSAYFDSLVNIKFYDSLAFHRVVPDFVIQGGDPNSKSGPKETWGEGDPNQKNILAEFSGVTHGRGIIGAARDTDINSANSQFYINLAANDFLDWDYTAYGQVVQGMDIVDLIVSTVGAARDENDNPDEKLVMFISKGDETNEIPGIPIITQPENDAVGLLELDSLVWNAVDGAVQYHLEISKDENFDSLYIDELVGFDYYRLPKLDLGNVKYFWRIRANNGGNISEYSEIKTFYSSIEAAILIYPEMNDDSISIQPTFTWEPVEGAAGYRIQIANAPNFSRMVLDVDTITVNRFTPPPLEANRSHYWRVYSLAEDYQGPVSEFRRFVTPDLTDIENSEQTPVKFELKQNYPNPFNPNTIITYSLPQNSFVSIKIYNTSGEEIIELVNEVQMVGYHNLLFDGSSLPSGIYYLSMKARNFKQTIKLMLLK